MGFILDDGDYYAWGCTAIQNSAVTGEVLGEGGLYGEWVTVNLIQGVDDRALVAVSTDGGCDLGADDEPLSDWTMAFSLKADGDWVLKALCRVGELTAAERDANGC